MEPEQSFVKIQFHETDVGYENIWASPLDDERAYIIESIPFFIHNISLKDVVSAHSTDFERLDVFSFDCILKKSGHKTIRARPNQFTLAESKGARLLEAIRQTGCEFETLPPRLVAIDVPSDAVLGQLIEFLGRARVPWEYADPAAELEQTQID